MAPETRTFEARRHAAAARRAVRAVRRPISAARRSTSRLFLALAAALFVYVLIWRTRLGYEIRTVGFNPTAAVYAGISVDRITIVTMLISGGAGRLMALNPIIGDQQRLQTSSSSAAPASSASRSR